MKPASHHPFISILGVLLLSAVVSFAAGKPARPASGTKGTVNFERTKTRINALLTERINPTPLPENLPNPFQLPQTTPPPIQESPKPSTEKLAPTTDSEMLLYYGAMLKISGTVRINDQTHLVINQSPYKAGDIFTLKTKEATAKLRVIAIAPGELTLGLNDAVQVIKFKK